MECLRTIAKVLEGIRDKNEPLGEQSREMVGKLPGATRELLNKVLVKDQK